MDEEHLIDIETKLAYLEKVIKDLNDVICEQQKGQLSEARRFAVKYDLNITAFIDFNQLQISGDINKVMPDRKSVV